jgi:hypothetical protein
MSQFTVFYNLAEILHRSLLVLVIYFSRVSIFRAENGSSIIKK